MTDPAPLAPPVHPMVGAIRIIAILNAMGVDDRDEAVELVAAYAALRRNNGDHEAAKTELLGDGAQRAAAALDRARALGQRGLNVRETQ